MVARWCMRHRKTAIYPPQVCLYAHFQRRQSMLYCRIPVNQHTMQQDTGCCRQRNLSVYCYRNQDTERYVVEEIQRLCDAKDKESTRSTRYREYVMQKIQRVCDHKIRKVCGYRIGLGLRISKKKVTESTRSIRYRKIQRVRLGNA